MQFQIDDWVATALGTVLVGCVGAWMHSVHKAADRAAAAAETASKALVEIQKLLGILSERTETHSKLIDGLGSDVRRVRDASEDMARDGQGVAAIVARHSEILEGLKCQGEGQVGHG